MAVATEGVACETALLAVEGDGRVWVVAEVVDVWLRRMRLGKREAESDQATKPQQAQHKDRQVGGSPRCVLGHTSKVQVAAAITVSAGSVS